VPAPPDANHFACRGRPRGLFGAISVGGAFLGRPRCGSGIAARSVSPSTNGTAARKSKAERKPRAGSWSRFTARRCKVALTAAMGCGIRLLSVALSTVSGTLARCGHGALALAALGLTCCVLAVSLSHLAWAVRDITGSPLWASWALAVAFDVTLVLSESVHVYAQDAGLGLLVSAVMVAVCGASMLLNVWAFLRQPAR
jgi:hypothetical protein